MVLTALRMMDSDRITDSAECTDTDLDTALSIIKTISAHNEYIFNVLNDGHTGDVKVSDTYSSAARNELLPSFRTTSLPRTCSQPPCARPHSASSVAALPPLTFPPHTQKKSQDCRTILNIQTQSPPPTCTTIQADNIICQKFII